MFLDGVAVSNFIYNIFFFVYCDVIGVVCGSRFFFAVFGFLKKLVAEGAALTRFHVGISTLYPYWEFLVVCLVAAKVFVCTSLTTQEPFPLPIIYVTSFQRNWEPRQCCDPNNEVAFFKFWDLLGPFFEIFFVSSLCLCCCSSQSCSHFLVLSKISVLNSCAANNFSAGIVQ